MTEILGAHNLKKTYGSIEAVDDFSFSVAKSEILGIIGPNGAGKTTVFDLLIGTRKPDRGQVILDGRDITRETPSRRCHRGMGRTYQVPRLFESMTVYENVLVGAMNGGQGSKQTSKEEVNHILSLLGLLPKSNHLAGTLRLVERKLLDLGRALATHPTVLLLDEPAAGLGEDEFDQVLCLVRSIHEKGITIVWIEHILMMMTEGTDRLLVMAEGRELFSGPPAEVLNAGVVLDAYLGREEE
jgi:branched-chain amino acid transport system ATP-binding protein